MSYWGLLIVEFRLLTLKRNSSNKKNRACFPNAQFIIRWFLKGDRYAQQLSPSSFTPSFLRIFSIKHQRVKEDCNRLMPTKPVNHNQLMFTYTANKRLIKMKVPAIARIYLFIMIIDYYYCLLFIVCYLLLQVSGWGVDFCGLERFKDLRLIHNS